MLSLCRGSKSDLNADAARCVDCFSREFLAVAHVEQRGTQRENSVVAIRVVIIVIVVVVVVGDDDVGAAVVE